LKKTNDSFGIKIIILIFTRGLIRFKIHFAMQWHDVLKESSSPDSFKGNYLSVLCVSSAAGGELIKPFQGQNHATIFRSGS